ncbi:MAG TPA: lytic transglycosylase domain-containing protein [Acidisphaera sp.]|nr:lytic transglycosylase domain-containing protein [Acidisphaera sp.]
MAVPRITPPSGSSVPLPQPLSAADAARLRRIFALQDRGKLDEAQAETTALGDNILLGHVLADRYLARYRSAAIDELRAWLARYADQPDAPTIRELLVHKLPKGAEAPPQPTVRIESIVAPDQESALPEDIEPDDQAARAGRILAASARRLFIANRDAQAMQTAAAAFGRNRGDRQVADPGYVAGLAAWRLDRIRDARHLFEAAAEAPVASPAIRAAAAFWTARAIVRLGEGTAAATPWLKRAAEQSRTFYGMIARRTLGLNAALSQAPEILGTADVEAIAAFPGGVRAFALLQIGQPEWADAEFRALWASIKNDRGLARSLMLIASQAGLTDLAADLATHVQGEDGLSRDLTRFPVPRLEPRGGFRVDPPLVYALTRLESNFNPGVVSRAGARGLMQLMPVTAGYIGNDRSLAGAGAARLHDPGLNLELGQRYLEFLSEQDGIHDDLIRMLASYNTGTGSFAHWGPDVQDYGDPLLFIEAIPNDVTRVYVQHALAYSWIYAARLHLPTPTLDALAYGQFPRFDEPSSPIRAASLQVH